ncbi:hypothetical protein B7486_03800 [cyanobacterium TDX16]|nr:hypothetical protein B7486_03800 [cyanobacterium TDX16]
MLRDVHSTRRMASTESMNPREDQGLRNQSANDGKRLQLVASAGLAFAVIACYLNSFDGAMLLDDNLIVAASQTKGSYSFSDAIHSARPLVDISFALNHTIGQLEPSGYHAVNLVIHVLATLVLFGLVRRSIALVKNESSGVGDPASNDILRAPDSTLWTAFSIALLWGVHPIQTESVTYIIQRSESMMGLFYLLMLYCLIRSTTAARQTGWTIATVAACALGMVCKPVMVTAPAAAVLYDRAFLAGNWRDVVRRRGWLHLTLAATWLILLATGVIHGVFAVEPDADQTVGFSIAGMTPTQYLLTQPGVILHYLGLAIWPDALCLDYQWPVTSSPGEAIWSIAIVIALLVSSVVLYLRRPTLGFVFVWFFLVLLPTSSFVPLKDVIFEHRMYLSLASVSVLFVIGARWILGRLCQAGLLIPSAARPIAVGTLLAVAAALGARSYSRNQDYHDSIGMWSSVVARYPEHSRALNSLAVAYYELGEYEKAIPHFEAAIRVAPNDTKARSNLAQTLHKLGRSLESAEEYAKAAELQPESWTTAFNQGNGYYEAGRDQEAIDALAAAKSINPGEIEAYIVTGNALTHMIRHDEAIAEYQDGIQLAKPSTPPAVMAKAYFNLANTLAKVSRRSEAIDAYRAAVRIDASHFAAYYGLGWTLQAEGRIPEAIDAYRASLAINPEYVPALRSLETLTRLQDPAN